jgi:hypothetical protein
VTLHRRTRKSIKRMVLNNLTDPLYEPSELIQACHRIPHLDTEFKPVSNDFDFNENYYISVIEFPAFIYGLMFTAISIFKLIVWFRAYCHSYWTSIVSYSCPNFKYKRILLCNPKRTLSSQEESIQFRTKSFYVLCASLMVVNCFVFYGSAQMTQAFHTFSDAATTLENTFSSISTYGADISNVTSASMQLVDTCSIATPLSSEMVYNLTLMRNYSNIITSSASPVQDDVQTFINGLTMFTVDRKDEIVVSFFCVVLVVCAWFSVALQQQSYFYFRVCLILAWPLLFLMALFTLLFEQAFIVSLA